MKANKYFLFLSCPLYYSNLSKPRRVFIITAMKITIDSGAYVNVVNFTDSTIGGIDGTIDIDGTLTVNGDMTNNSNGNVFTNIDRLFLMEILFLIALIKLF